MPRFDPNSHSGFIAWPKHLKNTGEGGMFVYAVVPPTEAFSDDKFIHCSGVDSVYLEYPGRLLEEDSENRVLERAWFPDITLSYEYQNRLTIPLLAAVCLGSTGGAWYDEAAGGSGRYWICTLDDLTVRGISLMANLRDLYGREAQLLTFLDT